MNISGKTKLCIIIGDPVEHSLSPAMHNAGYAELGIDDLFVFTGATVKSESLKEAISGVRAMGIRGLTCTNPHKIAVMKYLDKIDPIAQKIGAVNTVVNNNGILKGYNTDWLGAVTPLEKITTLKDKNVALIGAGGAARAVGYGVIERGANLTIFNRTLEKAEALARELDHNVETRRASSLSDGLDDFDIILNATSLGMGKDEGSSPVPASVIKKHHIVFDAVYVPYETQLLTNAKAVGATIIHGTEMLLHQGLPQFELYTGHKAPEQVMREVLMNLI